MPVTVTIHRGQNQIGGSIVEIASDNARIILDAGSELDEEIPAAPQIEGLFFGRADYDAAFISQYHGDHLGLCDQILPEIPVYIGRGAAAVINTARRYQNRLEYRFAGFYEAEKPIAVGDLRVTPHLCDHSAFDSYMFEVSCSGKTLLYSGDFRANGRKSFPWLLKRLPYADVLIVEGTTLSRAGAQPRTEAELESIATTEMESTDAPVFILQAATNIDRIVTVFKAARHCGRVLLQDLYTAEIASAAGGGIPNPKTFSGIRAFITDGGNGRYTLLDQNYPKAKIGCAEIAKRRFVMCVRPTMQGYLERLSQKMPFDGGLLFYSMWDGYKAKPDVAEFLHFMRSKGVRVVDLHTSGHADAKTILELIEAAQPAYLIPVHTENADWFEHRGNYTVVHSKVFKF